MWPIFQRLFTPYMGGGQRVDAESRNMSPATCTPTDIWGQPNDWNAYGVSVNSNAALSVPAVWDAVKKVSETLASLPLDLFERTAEGSQPAEGHAVRYLIRTEPSPYVTSYDFRRALFGRACFCDAFARIHRNGIGRPVRLELMEGNVYVGKTTEGGNYYSWTPLYSKNKTTEILMPYEVLHIKGFSLDTKQGLSVATVHRDTLGFAIGANQYGNAFFANNASVDKVLTVQGALRPDQQAQLQAKISGVSGAKKTGSTLVLDAGMDLKRIGLNPEESMLNESRSFQVNEISRVFGVPVHLLQNMDRATFNNIEAMNTTFVTLCLRPWAVQAEQEMLIKLLTRDEKLSERYFFRHNFEGLLRGDTAARSAFYASAILNGYMTRNEVREKENLNTIEGLDKPLVPVNMAIINDDGEIETPPQQDTNTPNAGQPGAGGKKQADGTSQETPAAAA